MWLNIIGSAIALVGVLLIFDARWITRENFKGAEENTVVLGIKILGAIITIVGGFVCIMFNKI